MTGIEIAIWSTAGFLAWSTIGFVWFLLVEADKGKSENSYIVMLKIFLLGPAIWFLVGIGLWLEREDRLHGVD